MGVNAPAPAPAPAQSPALFLFSRTDTGPLTLPLTTHVLSPYRPQYDHHAVTLETVAAVPGVVGAAHRHLRSLRCMKRDHGWINPLQEEAENERMHLLIWMQHTKPTSIERAFVMMAQVSPSPRRGVMWRIAGPTQPRRTTKLTPGNLTSPPFCFRESTLPRTGMVHYGLRTRVPVPVPVRPSSKAADVRPPSSVVP